MLREELDDLTDTQFLMAVRDCVRNEDFFPTVKTIRRYAGATTDQPDGVPHVGGMPLSEYLERVREGR
jgi:hypothetical protein